MITGKIIIIIIIIIILNSQPLISLTYFSSHICSSPFALSAHTLQSLIHTTQSTITYHTSHSTIIYPHISLYIHLSTHLTLHSLIHTSHSVITYPHISLCNHLSTHLTLHSLIHTSHSVITYQNISLYNHLSTHLPPLLFFLLVCGQLMAFLLLSMVSQKCGKVRCP